MLLHVNEAGIYGGQNKIGVLVHVYHVGIAIHSSSSSSSRFIDIYMIICRNGI